MDTEAKKPLQLLDLPNEILSKIVDEVLGQARKDVKELIVSQSSCPEFDPPFSDRFPRVGELITAYEKESEECVNIYKTTLEIQLVNKLFRDIVVNRGKAAEHSGANSFSILDTLRWVVHTQPSRAQRFAMSMRKSQMVVLARHKADVDFAKTSLFNNIPRLREPVRPVSPFWYEEEVMEELNRRIKGHERLSRAD